jgi:hypothetical protein
MNNNDYSEVTDIEWLKRVISQLQEDVREATERANDWREKFRKLDQGVRCEYCDPNGTIWECCKDRNKRTDEQIQHLRSVIKTMLWNSEPDPCDAADCELWDRLHAIYGPAEGLLELNDFQMI